MSTTNSISIGAFEAKTKLGELLERVGAGASYIITKRNKPVARLTGFEDEEQQAARRAQAAREIRELSKRYSLNGLSIRELIEEGRR
jgi:prevent-host-death family protein